MDKNRNWAQWCPWQGLVLYLAVGVLWVLVWRGFV